MTNIKEVPMMIHESGRNAMRGIIDLFTVKRAAASHGIGYSQYRMPGIRYEPVHFGKRNMRSHGGIEVIINSQVASEEYRYCETRGHVECRRLSSGSSVHCR